MFSWHRVPKSCDILIMIKDVFHTHSAACIIRPSSSETNLAITSINIYQPLFGRKFVGSFIQPPANSSKIRRPSTLRLDASVLESPLCEDRTAERQQLGPRSVWVLVMDWIPSATMPKMSHSRKIDELSFVHLVCGQSHFTMQQKTGATSTIRPTAHLKLARFVSTNRLRTHTHTLGAVGPPAFSDE